MSESASMFRDIAHARAASQMRATMIAMGRNPDQIACANCGKHLCDCPDALWSRSTHQTTPSGCGEGRV